MVWKQCWTFFYLSFKSCLSVHFLLLETLQRCNVTINWYIWEEHIQRQSYLKTKISKTEIDRKITEFIYMLKISIVDVYQLCRAIISRTFFWDEAKSVPVFTNTEYMYRCEAAELGTCNIYFWKLRVLFKTVLTLTIMGIRKYPSTPFDWITTPDVLG